jgi:hypothetical protein
MSGGAAVLGVEPPSAFRSAPRIPRQANRPPAIAPPGFEACDPYCSLTESFEDGVDGPDSLLGIERSKQTTSCGKHPPVFNTDHHRGTGACWPDRAAFASTSPQMVGHSKHEGPSARRPLGPFVGRGPSARIQKNSARNGLGFPMQSSWEASLGPIGTRMQHSEIVASCLINKGQFRETNS